MASEFTAKELNDMYEDYEVELQLEQASDPDDYTNVDVAKKALFKSAKRQSFEIDQWMMESFIDYGVQYLVNVLGSARQ